MSEAKKISESRYDLTSTENKLLKLVLDNGGAVSHEVIEATLGFSKKTTSQNMFRIREKDPQLLKVLHEYGVGLGDVNGLSIDLEGLQFSRTKIEE